MSSVVDTIYQRMQDDTEATVTETKGDSEVAKFYSGLSVFITGVTDLLGKCLLQKLLKDCSCIEKIYVLIRVKKEENFYHKCNKLYDDTVFDTLRRVNPNFASKIIPIKGNLQNERLDLTNDEYKTLTENVNVIFHNGAATKLNERIGEALKTNVLGTKRVLDLARDCKRLKAFVQVSSAFSHCHQRTVEEKFYRSPADLKTIDDMIVADAEAKYGMSKDALKMILGEWPNIFVFTKATAEELVQQHAVRAPYACCVFRPSVVVSTYKEPVPGWCDTKNGPASFFSKIALGAIHVMYKTDYPCDLIPADMSANAMLVCAWDAVDRWQEEPEAFVYNYGSSQEKPITMAQIKEKINNDENALISSESKRKPYVIFKTNFLLYFLLRIVLDYIPALIVDAITMAHGQVPEACSMVLNSMYDMCRLRRFTVGNWRIRMEETLKACNRLNDRDRELFFCDVRKLEWNDFFLTYWRGIRVYFLGEKIENTGEDQNKKCPCTKCKCPAKCACHALVLTLGFVVCYGLYSLLS